MKRDMLTATKWTLNMGLISKVLQVLKDTTKSVPLGPNNSGRHQNTANKSPKSHTPYTMNVRAP